MVSGQNPNQMSVLSTPPETVAIRPWKQARRGSWIGEAGSQAGVAQSVTVRRKTREKLAWGLAGVLTVACALLAVAYVSRAPEPPRTFRSTLAPPAGTALVPFDEFGLALIECR